MRDQVFTIGEIPLQLMRRFGITTKEYQIRRLFTDGHLPEPDRLGTSRIIRASDLGKIRRALEDAGYIKIEPVEA